MYLLSKFTCIHAKIYNKCLLICYCNYIIACLRTNFLHVNICILYIIQCIQIDECFEQSSHVGLELLLDCTSSFSSNAIVVALVTNFLTRFKLLIATSSSSSIVKDIPIRLLSKLESFVLTRGTKEKKIAISPFWKTLSSCF